MKIQVLSSQFVDEDPSYRRSVGIKIHTSAEEASSMHKKKRGQSGPAQECMNAAGYWSEPGKVGALFCAFS